MPKETNVKDTTKEVDLAQFNEPGAPENGEAAKGNDKPADEGSEKKEEQKPEDKPSETTEPKKEEPKQDEEKKAEAEKKDDGELTIESYASLDEIKEDGVIIDKDAVKTLKELALENKWDAKTAEKIVKIQVESAKKQVEAFKKQQKAWEEENQKAYGDNLKNVETNCSRVLTELDKTGKFKELLALAGAEKHPAVLEFLKSVGDMLLEKTIVNPNATATEKEVSLEDFN